MISLPYSKRKRYLNGADWLICGLDSMTRRQTGTGNVSQIVLELDGMPDPGELGSVLRSSLHDAPAVNGYIRRDLNLCPYWHQPVRIDESCFLLRCHDVPAEQGMPAVQAILERAVNAPFSSRTQHVTFTLIRFGERSFFAMQFDHRLLDARGAEAFLNSCSRRCADPAHCGNLLDPAPAYLDRWREKFGSGRQVNRLFRSLTPDKAPSTLPMPRSGILHTRFLHRSFDTVASAHIESRAFERAGYLMMLPYLLTLTANSMHSCFTRKGRAEAHYIVPVNLDGRGTARLEETKFFNHVLFTYYKFDACLCRNRQALCEDVKSQLYEQVKNRTSYHVEQASRLLRIVPAWVLARLLRIPFKGAVASYSFSYIGDSGYVDDRFMGIPVDNIVHMPRVPTPPGIGVFFTRYRGRLNLVLAYLQGQLDECEAGALVDDLTEQLTEKDGA